MIKYCFLFSSIFFMLNDKVFGQINLVPNPGFDLVDCEKRKVNDWETDMGSMFCNTCFPLGISPGPNFKAPFISPNPWCYSETYQEPNSGEGFVGVYAYGERTYATVQLKQPLRANKHYFARFLVAPHYSRFSWTRWLFTDAIGMAVTFRKKKPQFGDKFTFDIRPAERTGQMIRDTQNWTKVSGQFHAEGDEEFVTIGNFNNDKDTKVDTNKFQVSSVCTMSNILYIDDVIISEFNPLPDSFLLCTNTTKTFDASFYDSQYTWNDGSIEPTLTVSKPGRYFVEAKIDGLYFSDTVVVVPEKGYKGLPSDTLVCLKGPPVILAINVEAKYRWSTGQSSNAIAVNDGGRYSVTVTTPQCTLQFATDVKARDCFCDFYAPTAFSPNGDGENEVFKPFINCKVIYIKGYKFSIYNRFGNLIFTTTDREGTWDGTYKGQPCQPDVYAWVVEYNTLVDNDLPYRKVVESGDVTIMK
jgi:gliding motility-associated-like protein